MKNHAKLTMDWEMDASIGLWLKVCLQRYEWSSSPDTKVKPYTNTQPSVKYVFWAKAFSKVGNSSWQFRFMGAHCWDFTKQSSFFSNKRTRLWLQIMYFFKRIKIHCLMLRYKSSKLDFILLNKPKSEDNLPVKLNGKHI